MPMSGDLVAPLGPAPRGYKSRLRHVDMTAYMGFGVIISLAFHLFFLAFLAPQTSILEPEPILVSVIAPEELRSERKQIVSPSETPETAEPEKGFESERNATAEKETIHRGDSPDAGQVVGKNVAAKLAMPAMPSKQSNKPAPAKAATKTDPGQNKSIKNLTLDNKSLLSKFGSPQDKPTNSDQALKESLSGTSPAMEEVRPFSRPMSSGARFYGRTGTSDFLPNLPDGDITMLNEKASRFAGFVRRVATQVFSELRLQGWDSLSPADIRAISDFAKVRVILSLSGQILSIETYGASGSPSFDDVLMRAAKRGGKDPNPPPQAVADDGNIHIIFQAKSWVAGGYNPRNGAPLQRRWLLLGTGLE